MESPLNRHAKCPLDKQAELLLTFFHKNPFAFLENVVT
jgi:hypothetical protein